MCGTVLNRITPFASFTLPVCSTGCKNPQRNPQWGHHLPPLRDAMLLPTQHPACCTAQVRRALCTHRSRSSITDMHMAGMERTKLDHLVHFSRGPYRCQVLCSQLAIPPAGGGRNSFNLAELAIQ